MKQVSVLNRQAGTLRDDGVFVTHRSKEHVFRKFNGFGMSFKVLTELRKLNCRKIVLVYNDGYEEVIYKITPEDFLDKGLVYFDGCDSQRILSFDFLSKSNLRRWL